MEKENYVLTRKVKLTTEEKFRHVFVIVDAYRRRNGVGKFKVGSPSLSSTKKGLIAGYVTVLLIIS